MSAGWPDARNHRERGSNQFDGESSRRGCSPPRYDTRPSLCSDGRTRPSWPAGMLSTVYERQIHRLTAAELYLRLKVAQIVIAATIPVVAA